MNPKKQMLGWQEEGMGVERDRKKAPIGLSVSCFSQIWGFWRTSFVNNVNGDSGCSSSKIAQMMVRTVRRAVQGLTSSCFKAVGGEVHGDYLW